MSKSTEAEAHKKTFKEKKTPFYKKAIFPWVIIFTVTVFVGGTITGWTLRSDFSNEVSSQVNTVLDSQVSKNNQ